MSTFYVIKHILNSKYVGANYWTQISRLMKKKTFPTHTYISEPILAAFNLFQKKQIALHLN